MTIELELVEQLHDCFSFNTLSGEQCGLDITEDWLLEPINAEMPKSDMAIKDPQGNIHYTLPKEIYEFLLSVIRV